MRLRISVVCVFLMIPLVLLSSSCRTRTRLVAPRAEPISFSSPVIPEAQLASSQSGFLAADPEPRVERSDLSELNRRAHQEGWVRDAFFAFDSSRLDAGSTISYGEERPFALGSNERAWGQNRRAHLVLRGMERG